MDEKYIKEKLEEIITKKEKFLGILKDTKVSHLLRVYSNVFGYESGTYILNLSPDDTKTAKALYFKTVRGVQFQFWQTLNKYPDFPLSEQTHITGLLGTDFPAIFLCDHEEIIKDLLTQMKLAFKQKIGKNPDYAVTYAILHLLANDKEEARVGLGELYKKAKFWNKGRAYVLAGILHEDISLINYGINFDIKETIKGKLFNYSPNATALAKLAMRFGFEPDVSSSFINKKMLIHEDVDYEDIDNLYEALGVEPLTKYKLKNY